jgi:rSAM/selenodomain-associated transferase 2
MPQVSIIVPMLNEARVIQRTLKHLSILDPPAQEILLVDGGSTDATVDIAQQYAASESSSTPIVVMTTTDCGRALQMNQGAVMATGDILCFLHADTLVPDDFVAVVTATLAQPQVVCGGFISLMGGAQTTRWAISCQNYLKTYLVAFLCRPHLFFCKGLRVLFGDQAIFCQRQAFWNCGGFDIHLPIMEDADLCLRIVHYGKIRLINRVVQSSDRRLAQWGFLKATAIYYGIGGLWAIGVPAPWLKRFYEDIR